MCMHACMYVCMYAYMYVSCLTCLYVIIRKLQSRFTMKFFADISVEAARDMVYNFFASYHGSGLWDAHFAHNNKAIRDFLIHMEGLRKKCQSKDFSPLAELKQLARVLLAALDNTVVYEFYKINRDTSLKPRVKPIRGIKQYHCFQYVDASHVDCCIMCGDAWDVHHVSFTSGSQTRSSSLVLSRADHKNDDDEEEDEDDEPHDESFDDDLDLELDVDDDDDDDDVSFQWSTSTSNISIPSHDTVASRVSKRQRVSRSSFTSSGCDYVNIDDLDID